jgi:hypothetical protein
VQQLVRRDDLGRNGRARRHVDDRDALAVGAASPFAARGALGDRPVVVDEMLLEPCYALRDDVGDPLEA